MIRSVASWGVEVGCRGQRGWREEIESLQYAALRKCTGAVLGSRKMLVRKVAAVEDVEMFARTVAGRFLARIMCDPVRAGVVAVDDLVLGGKRELSLGGACCRGVGGCVISSRWIYLHFHRPGIHKSFMARSAIAAAEERRKKTEYLNV